VQFEATRDALGSHAHPMRINPYSLLLAHRGNFATVHDLPADLRKALSSDAKALAAWEDITTLARNEWICWTISVRMR
jgi:hypothetical protein